MLDYCRYFIESQQQVADKAFKQLEEKREINPQGCHPNDCEYCLLKKPTCNSKQLECYVNIEKLL